MINLPTLHLTPEQLHARETFCLETAWQALPPYCSSNPTNTKGSAGVRLRGHLVSTISDELLREFAHITLGAQRCSDKYLRALRIVLGNQADAERKNYRLELNIRNSFDVPERVMRNVIDQMKSAGITQGERVVLGEGRTQEVQCYDPRDKYGVELGWMLSAEDEMKALYRVVERDQQGARRQDLPCPHPPSLTQDDVPY